MRLMTASIIIPAHNEHEVIERCLSAITADAARDEFLIVVVCNGCTDDTAERASRHRYPVKVIQTPVGSKSNALNLGDAAAGNCFPRIYVDADVVVDADAVRQVRDCLDGGRIHAAAPTMRLNLADRGWAVRAYFAVWNALPYCRDAMVGSGVYGLSEIGRLRFARFPDTMADDNFVRMHFHVSERTALTTCCFHTTPPQTLWGLIKIKARGHVADRKLRRQFPDLYDRGAPDHSAALFELAMQPAWWPQLAVYVAVKLAVRVRAWIKFHLGDTQRWERDDSAREEQATAAGIGA